MAATATASSSGPRYAPPDPTLPKPWRGLVDGKTGYLYFWNPVTNVTQYERPTSTDSPPKSSGVSKSSSSQPDEPGPGKEIETNSSAQPDEPGPGKDTETNSSAQTDEPGPGKETETNSSAQTDEPGPGKETETNSSAQTDEHGPGKETEKRSSSQLDEHGAGKETERHSKASGDEIKAEAESGSTQILRGGSDYSSSSLNGNTNAGPGSSSSREHVPSSGVPSLSVEAYRRKHEITLMGANVPQPFMSFESTGFPSQILRAMHNAGFSAPTPIQAQSWPIALQGRDVVAVAKTGSGKTLGYLIPGFATIKRCNSDPMMGPAVLILSPTRELATQIQDEAVKFGQSIGISCACLYGGAQKGPQLRELESGVHIVVATPGRLNDVIEMKKINLHQVSYLVLDEADRMLDMGFEPQIRKIVDQVPVKRQTLMFTATWPKEVRKIASDLLVNSSPVQVNIGNVDELVANKSITQHVEVLAPMEKHRRLEQILCSQEPGSKIIIFCSTKRMCDQLASNLTRQFGAASIHGDKSQNERDHVLNQFRTGKSPVLVATDVAARGLDIKDIRVVVNYDFPTGVEDYVHRIGRTGRAGATGVAYTFFGDRDAKYASDLIKILDGANQQVPSELRGMASQGGGMGRSRRWSGGSDGGNRGYDGGFGGSGGRGGRGASTFSSGRQGAASGRGYGNESHERERSRSPTGWGGGSKNWSDARSSSPDRYNGSAGNDGPGPAGKSFHELMMSRGRT